MITIKIQWETLFASASVAAAVSIFIEVTAKPWIEARKDRIVRQSKRREEVISQLLTIRSTISLTRTRITSIWDTNEYLRELDGQVSALRHNLIAYKSFSGPVGHVLAHGLGVSGGLIAAASITSAYIEDTYGDSKETRKAASNAVANVLELTDEMLSVPIAYITTSRNRALRRYRLTRKARQILKEDPDFLNLINRNQVRVLSRYNNSSSSQEESA